ncbi:hypothetical protein NEMIN01_0423 [Nematocida minor]|uniref:uncharacterized protein n=1 Tax=Nematocida minor TaxID=1912983 RepID=UPI002220B7CA|nr:uncharacterized protein NEMIN01_0423 [Nematocida minor]KAI5189360.1 hypothetical protein NEMIN01_0423 [Nematocida minor]
MKEEECNYISSDEYNKLSSVLDKARRILNTAPIQKEENLSLGTLEYLKKYRIDT